MSLNWEDIMSKKLFFAVVVLILYATAAAVDFRVEFNSPIEYMGRMTCDRYFTIELYMNNTDFQRNGYSMPLRIYGPQSNGVDRIYWVDAGGLPETGGSVEILNGFGPDGDRFHSLNYVTLSGWDGILPDTFNHTTATTSGGWPPGEGELLVYRFHASAGGCYDESSLGQICLDSMGSVSPWLDWLWMPPSGPFGGPYCANIQFGDTPWPPRFVSGCPDSELNVNWGNGKKDTLTLEIRIDNSVGDSAITGALASFGDIVITDSIGDVYGGAFVDWSFDADYNMLGSYNVQLMISDHNSIFYDHAVVRNACDFTLNIINTPPTVTADCGATIDCCLGTSVTFPFQVTDVNTGDNLSFDMVEDAGGRATIHGPNKLITFTDDGNDGEALYEVIAAFSDRAEDTTYCTIYFNVRACCGDVNADGNLNLLDILYLIDHVYGTPPGPPPGQFAQGDVVTDGYLNLLDILYLINYLYAVPSGPAPPSC
jgi:hypothetical protein